MRGLMVVNAFLRSTKFTDVYETLRQSAQARGIALSVVTNAEVCFAVQAPSALAGFDFVLFWDKDVQLASQLEQLGLPVFNSAESILRCDDKALTWLCLRKSELRMPKTILLPKTFPAVGYPSLDFLDGTEAALGFPVVLKECFGSFGQQVYLLDTLEALKQKVQSLAGTPMLMQELVRESYGRDARINVVGGRVVASMLRTGQNGDFRSNITSGGTMEAYTPTAREAEMAVTATRLLGLDFAGVDVLFGKDGPILCEVNSNAHFKTTLACTGVNMADDIMAHIARKAARHG